MQEVLEGGKNTLCLLVSEGKPLVEQAADDGSGHVTPEGHDRPLKNMKAWIAVGWAEEVVHHPGVLSPEAIHTPAPWRPGLGSCGGAAPREPQFRPCAECAAR